MKQKFILIYFFNSLFFSNTQTSGKISFPFNQFNVVRNFDSDNVNPDDNISFGFGMYGNSKIKNNFILNWGIEYDKLNFHLPDLSYSHFTHQLQNLNYRVDYLTIPVSLQGCIEIKKTTLFLECGLSLDLMLDGRLLASEYDYYFSPPVISLNKYSNAYISPPSIGYSAGIGFQFPIHNIRLVIKPQIKNKLYQPMIDYSSFSINYFCLSLGIKFKA
ncbi:MAG: hypothetical protein NT126_13060 [Bacteroidetes bacterium]|nr:hypothetical protein [Bacteroidota bacterium]